MQELQTDNASPWRDILSWLILAFRPPDAQAIQQLAGVDPQTLVERMGWKHVALAPLEDTPGEPHPLLKLMQPEYVRLFVNAPHTPVAYLDAASYLQEEGPEAQTALLEELTEALKSAGLAIPASTRIPLDHLATLLEVLFWSDMIGAAEARNTVLRILRIWVPQMLERLDEARPHVWYENAARLLGAALELDVHFSARNPSTHSENPHGVSTRQPEDR